MNHLVAIPLLSTVLVVAAAATAQTPAAQPKFPPEGWARLAAIEAQVNECLKAASKSPREGMECKFAQANELPPLDRKNREWFGEFYDRAKYRKCLDTVGQATNVACEYLRLMRVPEPEYWPYPDVPRPKWPEAPNPAAYKRGMSSKQYFEALCKAEAGEFIYTTVNEVEGVYQIRPRKQVSEALYDRFVMEDPYGYTDWEAEAPEEIFVRGRRAQYRFFEAPARLGQRRNESRYDASMLKAPPPEALVERYSGFDGSDWKTFKKEFDVKPRSRYGFTWRGIKRERDREMGIAGGELIVVDLGTGEILGVRRGFALSGTARNRSGFNWETAQVCPKLRKYTDGSDKFGDFSYWFISKVLRPVGG